MMNIRMLIGRALGGAVVLGTLLGAGCGIFETSNYRPVRYFDLGRAPERTAPPLELAVGTLRNDTAFRGKFIYSRGLAVEIDEYNQFIQSPEAMLKRLIAGYFAAGVREGKTAEQRSLRGSIFLFAFDMERGVAELGMEFRIFSNGKREDFSIRRTCKMQSSSPDGCARAMARCAAEMLRELDRKLQK